MEIGDFIIQQLIPKLYLKTLFHGKKLIAPEKEASTSNLVSHWCQKDRILLGFKVLL